MNKYYIFMIIVMAISLVVGLIARSISRSAMNIVNITSWIVLAVVALSIIAVLFVIYPNGNISDSYGSAAILGILFMASWATYPSFIITYGWKNIFEISKKKSKLISVFFYLLPSVFITIFIPYVLIWLLTI